MEGCIDNLQVLLALNHLGIDADFLDALQIDAVNLLANGDDEVFVALKLHIIDGHLVHLVDDTGIVGSEHLGTIFPIGLVAVVLFGVVAGGDVDTGLALQFADGEGTFGSGAHVIEEISLDAVGRKDVGHGLSIKAAVVTAVVANDYGNLIAVSKVLLQIIGKALGGHTHGINVHAIAAGTHDATQTTRTKLQVFIEALDQFGLVFIFQHLLHCVLGLLIECR